MAKTNVQIALEQMSVNKDFLYFQWEMIDYYKQLRRVNDEDMAVAIGVKKATFSSRRRGGMITPQELEKLIEFLRIEDLDANRIRSKYWGAMVGHEVGLLEFNRLYATDAESIIRELFFENEILKRKLEYYSEDMTMINEAILNSTIEHKKAKP